MPSVDLYVDAGKYNLYQFLGTPVHKCTDFIKYLFFIDDIFYLILLGEIDGLQHELSATVHTLEKIEKGRNVSLVHK